VTLKTLLIGAGAMALVAGAGTVAAATTTDANPLLARWAGPFGGVPPWDKVKVEHLQPGLDSQTSTARQRGAVGLVVARL